MTNDFGIDTQAQKYAWILFVHISDSRITTSKKKYIICNINNFIK